MVGRLRDISLKYLIDTGETRKLLSILNTDKINNNQRNIIIGKMLSDNTLIKNAVNKYYNLLDNFKYKDDIVTLYNLINNLSVSGYLESFMTKNYINNMSSFNENDSSFLWFVLNLALHKDIIKYENRHFIMRLGSDHKIFNENINENDPNDVYFKFTKTTDVQKMIGLMRVSELNLNKNNYLKSWDNSLNFRCYLNAGEKEHIYGDDENSLIFEYRYHFVDRIKVVKLFKDYSFYIYNRWGFIYYFDERINRMESYEYGNVFKYEDKYYIDKYTKSYRIINGIDDLYDNITDELLLDNPYIDSASRHLNEVLPFMRDKKEEIDCSYEAKIINGKYVKNNVFKNEMNFTMDDINMIHDEISNLE